MSLSLSIDARERKACPLAFALLDRSSVRPSVRRSSFRLLSIHLSYPSLSLFRFLLASCSSFASSVRPSVRHQNPQSIATARSPPSLPLSLSCVPLSPFLPPSVDRSFSQSLPPTPFPSFCFLSLRNQEIAIYG